MKTIQQELTKHVLTDQEMAVARLLGLGLRAKMIAARLRLSNKTAEFHVANVKRKLQMDNAEIGRWCENRGMVQPGEKFMEEPKPNSLEVAPPEFTSTADLAHAILQGCSRAAINKCDVQQMHALCLGARTLMDLANFEIDLRQRTNFLPQWMGEKKARP